MMKENIYTPAPVAQSDRKGSGYDREKALEEIRQILLKKELIDSEEGLAAGMLEDLVQFAYFTGCITKGDVGRLLGLAGKAAKAQIRSWKKWQDGNRSCQLQQNPFYLEWPAEDADPEKT